MIDLPAVIASLFAFFMSVALISTAVEHNRPVWIALGVILSAASYWCALDASNPEGF